MIPPETQRTNERERIQRVKELEAFIRESEGHKIDCSLFTLFTPCDCGYDEARKALNL